MTRATAPPQKSCLTRFSERGLVLPIALVFLLILAVLVGSLVHQRRLQARLAIDLQARVRSFQAAENTLSAGERWLESQATAPSCSATPCADPRLQPPATSTGRAPRRRRPTHRR
jgi:Tfp pilus assembly protein PilX